MDFKFRGFRVPWIPTAIFTSNACILEGGCVGELYINYIVSARNRSISLILLFNGSPPLYKDVSPEKKTA